MTVIHKLTSSLAEVMLSLNMVVISKIRDNIMRFYINELMNIPLQTIYRPDSMKFII